MSTHRRIPPLLPLLLMGIGALCLCLTGAHDANPTALTAGTLLAVCSCAYGAWIYR